MDDDLGPSRRVATELRHKIATGALAPGARVPSTRQLVQDHGIAMATASRVLAILRDEGLIETRAGFGSTVRGPDRAGRHHSGTGRVPRHEGGDAVARSLSAATRRAPRELTSSRIVAAANAIADREGLDAVSMRAIAGVLGVTPMSLYRHVAGREQLEHLMIRAAFGAHPLPAPGAAGWRERLEEIFTLQWRLYRRHPWLAELLSVTRPQLVPEAMEHSERTLEALELLGLEQQERLRAALALASLVRGLGLTVAEEARAERETRMRTEEWWTALDGEIEQIFRSGRFPRLAAVENTLGTNDLDALLEHSLTRYLDGLEVAASRRHTGSGPAASGQQTRP